MEIIESIKQAIAKKDFQKLEDLWTDMVLDKQVNLNDFFEITKDLKKLNESERALLLLEMLAAHLESNNEYAKVIEVYKNMVYHVRDDTEIRKKIINLYKLQYKESEHLDEYLKISGFKETGSIFKAIEKLEEFLKYDVGTYFYFERYGTGEVIEVIPSKKEIVIDFEKKKRHFLTLDIARGLLMPLNKEHFLYIKHKNIDDLKEIALADPVELIKFMLKSFQEPLTASQIKMYLHGIIEKQELNKFWEKLRKKLEKNNKIKISGKTAKTYTYIESNLDKIVIEIAAFNEATEQEKYLFAEEYAKKMPAVFKRILPGLIETGNKVFKQEPALALDILMLCNDLKTEANLSYTADTILDMQSPEDIVKKLNNFEHQIILLKLIKEKNPKEWTDIFRKLIFTVNNFKLLDDIAENLKCVPDKLKDIYYTIFSVPRQYPQQFLWMLRKMQSGDLQEYLNIKFIPRLIDSLNYVKGIKIVVNKILSLENFDRILKQAKDEDARRILEIINNNEVLEDYKKKDFLRIIEHHFPHLIAKKIDIIHTTETALLKRKEELNKIITIEIPENKKEISRAREFGDLSDNFEYKAAKERQDQLYQKVRIIESELQKIRIIDPANISTDKVDIGTKIRLKNLQDGKPIHYTILGRWDTNLEKNIISNEAPVAKSLLNKVAGDHITLNEVEYEIVEIEKGL
jgi:transcription elongation GreA/GreB family factor